MAYTPQFSQRESAVVRRIAWAMKIPMTRALSSIVNLATKCSNGEIVCQACKDNNFCSECPFKDSDSVNCTFDDTCPHCSCVIEDLWEYFSDQSDPRFECPYCGKLIEGKEVITYRLCQAGGGDGPE